MSDGQVSLRDFFEEKFRALDEKADQILAKQDITNGRVRAAELAIVVLQWAYALGVAVIAWIVYKQP